MDFKDYLKELDAQVKINRLAKMYKNKKIAIYGAGQYSMAIFENYDLSKLNIVAISDRKFNDITKRNFFGLNCVAPFELPQIDFNILLVANLDYYNFSRMLDREILYGTKKANIEMRPLIKVTFSDLLKKKLEHKREK